MNGPTPVTVASRIVLVPLDMLAAMPASTTGKARTVIVLSALLSQPKLHDKSSDLKLLAKLFHVLPLH